MAEEESSFFIRDKQKLKPGKNFSIFMICFFISFTFWLLLALSKNYETAIKVKVFYSNAPNKKVIMGDTETEMKLNVLASGFNIIGNYLKSEDDTVMIDLSSKIPNAGRFNSDALTIPSETFIIDIKKKLGTNITVKSIIPDIVSFNFSSRSSKRLPVKLSSNMTFEKQFDTSSKIIIVPDSITVFGPPSVLNKTSSLRTKLFSIEKANKTVRMNVELDFGQYLKSEIESVSVTIPIEKFTEGSVEVPVHVINMPKGFSLKTFPDKVRVRYQVALSAYDKINSGMFDPVVDGDLLNGDSANKLQVKLITKPNNIKSILIEPDRIDYILRKL